MARREDIQFTFEAVLSYPEIGVAAGDNPMTLEVVGEQDFNITLERPDGLYLRQLCCTANGPWTVYPTRGPTNPEQYWFDV